MRQQFLSWLGLGVTGRTFVTKANCTPASQSEHCGKSFIFNREFLGWYVGAGPGGLGRTQAGPHTFCLVSVTIPGKTTRALPFHRAAEYALGVEDLSKTESGLGSLIPIAGLAKSSPVPGSPADGIHCRVEQSMPEPAVVNPAALTIARPEPGEYAPRSEERRVGKECRSRWSPY